MGTEIGKRAAANATDKAMPAPFAVFFAALAIPYRFGGFAELREESCGLDGVGWMPAGGARIDGMGMGGGVEISWERSEDHEFLGAVRRLAESS